MKNLYTKYEYLNKLNEEEKMLNEGFFSFLGKMYNKVKGYINKIKGGKEIDAIYKKYLGIINQEFLKRAQVNLNLSAEEQAPTDKKPVATAGTGTGGASIGGAGTGLADSTNYSYDRSYKLNEEDTFPGSEEDTPPEGEDPEKTEADKKIVAGEQKTNLKLTSKTLAAKKKVLDNILKLNQDKARKEMDRVLIKMGGREKNPKLAIMIDNMKDEFQLAFYNAQIKALEKGGDKVSANKLATQRNQLAKNLDARWNLDSTAAVEIELKGEKYKIGVPYRYNSDGVIRTIKLIKKSENPDNFIAAYTYNLPDGKKTAGKEQEFIVDNISMKDFNPKKNEKYKYYSNSLKTIIPVMLLDNPNNGVVQVKTLKLKNESDGLNSDNVTPAEGEPYKINVGSLLAKLKPKR